MRARTIGLALAIVALLIGGALWLTRDDRREPRHPPGNGGTPGPADPDPDTGTPHPGGGEIPAPAPIPAGPETEAYGRVIDHLSGRGVPEATVTVTEGRDPRVLPLTHARTNSSGIFLCRFPERESFELTVRAEGYAPARWPLSGGTTPEGIPLEVADLALELAPESVLWIRADLPGLDPEEKVIVEVQLRQARTPVELGEPVHDKQSVAIVSPECRVGGLAMGQYLLSFRTSKQRLGSREIELGMAEERLIEFALGPPVPIHGVVRHNGHPVSGGKLVIWGRDHHSNTAAIVDEQGSYQVILPAPGSYSFAFSPSREVPEDGGGGSQELRIESSGAHDLEFRSSHLVGRVLGPLGEPLPDWAGTLFGPQALSFRTDELGEFEFENVPHGVYRWLFPLAPDGGFGPAREFSVEEDTDTSYQFEVASVLEVTIRRDPPLESESEVGRPQVCLLEAEGQVTPLRPTGEKDRYHWPAGGGIGVVVQRGWSPWFFELGPADHPTPQVATLTPGGELTVTIFDAEGQPSGNHSFRIEPVDAPRLPAEWAERRTGPRGSARLSLAPGTYRVRATLLEGEVEREIRIHAKSSTEARLP